MPACLGNVINKVRLNNPFCDLVFVWTPVKFAELDFTRDIQFIPIM